MIRPTMHPTAYTTIASVVLVMLMLGCEPTPHVLDGSDLAAVTGVSAAIEFRTEGESLDAQSDNPASLSLTEASSRAVRHDPGLQAALARVRAALAESEHARLLPNPILFVAVRLPEGGIGKPVIEADLVAGLVAILHQPRRSRAADNRLRSVSAEALNTAIDVLTDVQITYASAQALDADLLVLQERKILIERLLDLAKARVEFGESPQLDVLTLDSERIALEVELTQAKSQRRQLRLELARRIGEPSSTMDWQLDPFVNIEAVPTNEAEWMTRALLHRPDIQAERWKLAALGDDLALAKFAVFEGTEVGVSAERDPDWAVGPALTIPLPLFDWGQARQARAQADVIEARHQLVQKQREAVQDVRQAIGLLVSAQEALQTMQTRLIPLQQKRIEQAEAAYRNGLADITAVLVAEQQSQAARQTLIQLQKEVASAQYRLQRAVGGSRVADALPSTRPATVTTALHEGDHENQN